MSATPRTNRACIACRKLPGSRGCKDNRHRDGTGCSAMSARRVLRYFFLVLVAWCAYAYLFSLFASVDDQQAQREAAFRARKLFETGFTKEGEWDLQALRTEGVFPRGCKWQENNVTKEIEYWDNERGGWDRAEPRECYVEETPPDRFTFFNSTPRSQVYGDKAFWVIGNLWYNNGQWYFLVDDNSKFASAKITQSQNLLVMHVKDADKFINNIKWKGIVGDTVILDYIFFMHPTAIGHWLEMLFPLFSQYLQHPYLSRPRQVVLLHLSRLHLFNWVRSLLGVTLGVKDALPTIMLQKSGGSIHEKLTAGLEQFPANMWVCFQRVLIWRDQQTGGKRTFLQPDDATLFRKRIYNHYGLPDPVWRVPPRIITFQRKSKDRRIINEDEFMQLLGKYGEVRIVEYNLSSSFFEQLEMMSQTGVFVSVHTSNLANAILLPPGSAVVEIIQRNWAWNKIDQGFKNHVSQYRDVHYFAYRAQNLTDAVYLRPRDRVRFGNWSASQCTTEQCVEAHTHVDVHVDIKAMETLLDAKLPKVFRGASVKELEMPWPPIE